MSSHAQPIVPDNSIDAFLAKAYDLRNAPDRDDAIYKLYNDGPAPTSTAPSKPDNWWMGSDHHGSIKHTKATIQDGVDPRLGFALESLCTACSTQVKVTLQGDAGTSTGLVNSLDQCSDDVVEDQGDKWWDLGNGAGNLQKLSAAAKDKDTSGNMTLAAADVSRYVQNSFLHFTFKDAPAGAARLYINAKVEYIGDIMAYIVQDMMKDDSCGVCAAKVAPPGTDRADRIIVWLERGKVPAAAKALKSYMDGTAGRHRGSAKHHQLNLNLPYCLERVKADGVELPGVGLGIEPPPRGNMRYSFGTMIRQFVTDGLSRATTKQQFVSDVKQKIEQLMQGP